MKNEGKRFKSNKEDKKEETKIFNFDNINNIEELNNLKENNEYNKITKRKFLNLKNRKDIKNHKLKISKKAKKVLIIILILIILSLGIIFGVKSYHWKNLMEDMFTNECSIVVDQEGNEIAKIGSERKKENISLADIPQNLKNAYIGIEDERFYSHHGVDIKRTSSAILSYIIHFGSSSYGGSTITQQLVKNLTGDNTDSIFRKVKEWIKSYELEMFFTKDEILEMYLNVIYVGPNIYGVQAGSKYYFSKDVQNLSLAECAFLAGINNSPNSYNPFGDEDNSEKIKKRTKTVLAKMLELEYISQDEYNSAIKEVENGLKFKKGTIQNSDGIYSYHTDALINEVINDISEKEKITQTFATNYLYLSGLTINSTQISSIQEKTENEMEKTKYQIKSQNSNDTSQAAMVIIDQSTGRVVSCVGGLGKKTDARGFNRAIQSTRQTGSAMKPIAVLAPAIDKKEITAATIFDDTQKVFKDNYSPENYDGYLGKITVRRALESSQNIPFVEIMEKLTPKTSIKYLKKMGITTLTDKDNNLSLALGGLDKGISPLEMASAYATIANNGVYIEPTFYIDIINKKGETVIKSNPKSRRVFSEATAYVLQELLTQPVLGNNGTATYCNISGMDVAAKTGTTDDNFDRWLCGFTPYYTAATWFGYDQNETIYFNNQNPAGLIWSNVMKSVHTNLEKKKFQKPNGVTTAMICSQTGLKANTGCTNTYEEYFIWGTVPKECNEHKGSTIKNNSNNKSNSSNLNNTSNITNNNNIYNEITEDEIENNNSNENKTLNNIKNETKTNNTTTNSHDNKNEKSSNNSNFNNTNTNSGNLNTNSSKNESNNNITNSNTNKNEIINNTTNINKTNNAIIEEN